MYFITVYNDVDFFHQSKLMSYAECEKTIEILKSWPLFDDCQFAICKHG